jgi:branched-chain amino acid transport system permease protein
MSTLMMAVGFGLVTASVLAVASVGLSLQFGITNYINFAYGDFMALGAYISYELNTSALQLNIWVAMIGGALVMGVLAVLLNRFLLGPFARRFQKTFYVLIVTFGLSLIILNVINSIWGADVRRYQTPVESLLHLGPFLLTIDQLIVMAVSVVLMVLIHFMLKATRLGKSMRAMSDNTTLAMTSGIDTRRVTTITWFLSGALAGLAGTVLGITEVIVGGVGSIYGAMVGALIIGLAIEISALVIDPSYKLDTAFVILILALLFRPSGLFARPGKA